MLAHQPRHQRSLLGEEACESFRVVPVPMAPSAAKRSFTCGSASACFAAAWIAVVTGTGSPAGPYSPFHSFSSYPG